MRFRETRLAWPTMTTRQFYKAVRRLRTMMSAESVADALGCTPRSVNYWLRTGCGRKPQERFLRAMERIEAAERRCGL